MRILAKSDIGKARDMNQDCFYVSDLNKDEIKLYIVADGMGGYKGGEIASSVAVKSVKISFLIISKNQEKIENLFYNY